MSRIPIVVIGAGHLGTIHTRLACSVEEFEVLGIVDPSATARQRVSQQLSVAGYESVDQLPVSPQAAIVAAPTGLHHQLGQQLLSRGVHVLMEKPITVHSAQGRELVELARQHQAVLQVGHVERFNPTFELLKQKVERAKFVQTRRFSEYTFRSTDVGVVLDLMIHDLDLVLSLIDSPVARVDAVGISVMGEHEDIAHARLEFENGSVANLEVSRCSFVRERSVQVFADNAYAQADLTTRQVKSIAPPADLLARAVDFLHLPGQERDQVRASLFSQWLPVVDETAPEANAILEEQRDFARAIRTGQAPRVCGAQGTRALEVAERILAEIQEHAWYGKSYPVRGALAVGLPRVVAAETQTPSVGKESIAASAASSSERTRRAG